MISLKAKTLKSSDINLIKNKMKEINIFFLFVDNNVINKGYPVLFDLTFLLYVPYQFIIICSLICFDCTFGDISSNDDNLTGLSSVLFLIILYNQLNVNEEKNPAGYTIFFDSRGISSGCRPPAAYYDTWERTSRLYRE